MLQVDLLAFELSGYGWSNGESNEENINEDIEDVWYLYNPNIPSNPNNNPVYGIYINTLY